MRRRVILVAVAVIAQAAGLLGLAPAQAVSPTLYTVSKSGTTYIATPTPGGQTYTDNSPTALKTVVESAVADLEATAGPGQARTVQFTAGEFNLGSAFFKFDNIHDLIFKGAGTGTNGTKLFNSSGAAA